jgi:hypothetical protein
MALASSEGIPTSMPYLRPLSMLPFDAQEATNTPSVTKIALESTLVCLRIGRLSNPGTSNIADRFSMADVRLSTPNSG